MIRKQDCVSALVLSLAICACGPSRMEPSAEERVLRESEVNWAIEWGSRDIDRILSHFADDAVLILPGCSPFRGKNAIRDALDEFRSAGDPVVTMATSFASVSPDAKMAYTAGKYSITLRGVRSDGQYLVVYRKQQKQVWRAVSTALVF